MMNYISETKHASSSLINLMFEEERRLNELEISFNFLKKQLDTLYLDFSTSDLNEDFNEAQVQQKYARMAEFAQSINLKAKKDEFIMLKASIESKKTSIQAIGMSLLQIAKQGISMRHGSPNNWPRGRQIGREWLSNIIISGRNQAMHYEENNLHPNVRRCFENLAADFGQNFNLNTNTPENKSKYIIDLLGWNEYKNYENDMSSLLT